MGGGIIPMVAQKGNASMYRTQKARGIEAGFNLASEAGNGYRVAVSAAVLPYADETKIQEVLDRAKARGRMVFARPCPIRPRHGFVESRPVQSLEDILKVYQETVEQEPLGEVILMERLTGKYSAVMTATGVAFGRDNDGVTSGKGEQRIVPAPSGRFDELFLPRLGIDPRKSAEGVYIELVEETGVMCVVQMRLGPKQPDSRLKRVLVATHVYINRIIKPDSDDLIEWDNKLKRLAAAEVNKKTLVWLPGQSLSSHFAVQGIAQGFNVSVEETCPVEVFQELQPDKNELIPLGQDDFVKLAKYLENETKTVFWDFPRECLLSVAVLHALPYWDNTDYLLRLRARGAVAAARFALSACLGESRHKSRKIGSSDESGESPVMVPWDELMGEQINLRYSRSYVFLRAFGLTWDKAAGYAKAAAQDMILPGWDPVMEWLAKGNKLASAGTGYRGPKWEWAALKCHDLIVAIDKFIATPNQDNWGLILGLYNEIINAAHNGGYLINKWVGQGLVDNVASSPALAFGYPQVMNIVWGDCGGVPGQPWLPLAMFPKGSQDTYVNFKKGVRIHVNVYKYLKDNGKVLDGGKLAGACECTSCLQAFWIELGVVAIGLGLPCYVPVDTMPELPVSLVNPQVDVQDHYSATVKANMDAHKEKEEEEAEEEAEDEPAICCECEQEMEDGKCVNEDCEASPCYTPPSCCQCDTTLEDDACPNTECKASPNYEAPDEGEGDESA